MSEELQAALLDFYVAWFVCFDMVTPRDHVWRVMQAEGIDREAVIAQYRATIQPRIDAFDERIRQQEAERQERQSQDQRT